MQGGPLAPIPAGSHSNLPVAELPGTYPQSRTVVIPPQAPFFRCPFCGSLSVRGAAISPEFWRACSGYA